MSLIPLVVTLLVLLAWSSHLAASQTMGITVEPSTDHLIPINSLENFSYNCRVSNSRQAIWEINNRQISGQNARDTFAALGVNVTGVLGGSETQLTFTPAGRETYLSSNQTRVPIRCTAFDNDRAVTEFGETLFVIIYDIPAGPLNVQFNPNPNRLSQLTLSWDTPPGTPTGVPVHYIVTISGPRVNVQTNVTNPFYQFEDSMSQTCEEHTFSIQAINPAGPGVTETMNETIPISPDISTTSLGLSLSSLDLFTDGRVRISVDFPLGSTCDATSFPIRNYSVIVTEANSEGQLQEIGGVTRDAQSLIRPVLLDFPALRQDRRYEIIVRACISIACRNTTEFNRTLSVDTSDVQNASVVFFDNNIFLSCSLADAVAGRGCIFNFSLVNSSELFYVARDESSKVITQCNVSSSQNAAYTSFEVLDWESDGSLGELRLPISPRPPDIELEEDYTQLTGCVVPRPGGLSGGAVAGIVLTILAVLAVAIAIVMAVLVYKLRTGKWFKLRQKDEEKVTVDFALSLLMEDEEPSGPLTSIRKKWSVKRSLSTKPDVQVADVVDGPGTIGVYTGEVDTRPPSIDSKMQEERKIATEEAGETEVGVTEVGGAEVGEAEVGGAEEGEAGEGGAEASFVNIPSLKPDAAIVPHHAAILAGTQTPLSSITPSISPQAQSLAAPVNSMDFSIISPNAAFTLDIVDEKRVRLHLNRGLIRRVLQQNKIRALERRARTNIKKLKPKGTERSDSRPLLSLALTSEVRVADVNLDEYVVI